MGFEALFSKCRDMFVVSSDITLRAQLKEFKEHQVIKEYPKDHTLYIPLGSEELQQILDNQKTNKAS
jgi:origin recognition complex subunit 2